MSEEDDVVAQNENGGELQGTPRRSTRKKTRKAPLDYDRQEEQPETPRTRQKRRQEQHTQNIEKLGDPWTNEELRDFFDQYKTHFPTNSLAQIKVTGRTQKQIAALIGLHMHNLPSLMRLAAFVAEHRALLEEHNANMSDAGDSKQTLTPQRRSKRHSAIASPPLATTPTHRLTRANENTPSSHWPSPQISNAQSSTLSQHDQQYKHHPRKQNDVSPLPPDTLLASQISTLSGQEDSRTKALPLKLQRKRAPHGAAGSKVQVQLIAQLEDAGELTESMDEMSPQIQQQLEQLGLKMSRVLTSVKARRFCVCEWFYPVIDYGFFSRNEFMEWIKNELTGVRVNEFMTRREWNQIRLLIDKPRRLSFNYLREERKRLHLFRQATRLYYKKYYYKQAKGVDLNSLADEYADECEDDRDDLTLERDMLEILDDFDIVEPLQIGERVLARLHESSHVYLGTVKATNYNYYSNHVEKMKKRKKTATAAQSLEDLHLSQEYLIHFDHDTNQEKLIHLPDVCVMRLTKPHIISEGLARKKLYYDRLKAEQIQLEQQQQQQQELLATPPSKRMRLLSSPLRHVPPQPSLSKLSPPPHNVMNMAQLIILLRKKAKLVEQFSMMNDEAKTCVEQHGELRLSDDFCLRYAYVILQLKNINGQIPSLLGPVMPLTKPRVSPYEIVFTDNRNKADKLVEDLKNEIQKSQKTPVLEQPLTAPSSSAKKTKHTALWCSKSVTDVIAACAAFMYHLQTCVHDENITMKDASLLLTGGVMALKPKVSNSNMVCTPLGEQADPQEIYGQIEDLVQQAKMHLAPHK